MPAQKNAVPDRPARLGRSGWVAVLKRAGGQFQHDAVTDRAAALTYYGVLALFPAMLVLVSILGLLGRGTTQELLDNVGQLAPGGVQTFLRGVINQVQGRAGAASIAAVVGILLAIWSASGYVAGFMRAMNAIFNVEEGRPFVRTAAVRLGVTVATLLGLVVSALMVAVTGSVARKVGSALGIGNTAVTVWDIAKWPVLVIIVSLMLSLLYWATPNAQQDGPRWVTPGGIVAVLAWLVVSGLFALYVSFSGSYNKTYGSLATVIVFLVWLWLTNVAILLGAEINAELQHQRVIDAGLPEDVDPFVPLRDTRKLSEGERQRVEQAEAARDQALAAPDGASS